MRVQITMQDDLVKKIDNYADALGISRSSAISVLCSNALQTEQGINAMNELLKIYQNQTDLNFK